MEYLKEAFGVADIILENSWTLWTVYISFFILALAVHKKGNRTRRVAGNVMLAKRAGKAPGLITLLYGLGLIGYDCWFFGEMMMFFAS